jgi:predicted secreted Zn-dependent protease
MRHARSILALLLLFPTPCIAGAQLVSRPMPRGVVFAGNVERFPVGGSSIEEITASLRSAIGAEGGVMGHYAVSWRYTYQLTNASSKAGCRPQNVRVDMQARIRVPDWKVSPDAPEDVSKAWETFQTALENHLREHENLSIRAAGDFVQRLERMSDMSCRTLGLDVQREARAQGERLQQRQRKLDEDTQHGTKGGARWPPPPPAGS